MSVLLALGAAIGWGSSDFAAGHASRKSSAVSVVILTHFAAVVALFCFALDFGPVWTMFGDIARSVGPGDDAGTIRWSGPGIGGSPTAVDLAWGVAAGVGGGMGAMLLFRGLGRGSMAVVAPITAAGAATIPVLFGIVTGDPITFLGVTGIALALVAIVLVSLGGAADDASEPLTVPDNWSAEFRLPQPLAPVVPASELPAPDRGARSPGTVPPGTVPPGTVPPGTVTPGTVTPGTVTHGATLPPPISVSPFAAPPSPSSVGSAASATVPSRSTFAPPRPLAPPVPTASPSPTTSPVLTASPPPNRLLRRPDAQPVTTVAPPLPAPEIEMMCRDEPPFVVEDGEVRVKVSTVRQAVLALVATAVLSAAAIASEAARALLDGGELTGPIAATLVFALVIIGLAAFALNSVKPLFDFSDLTLRPVRVDTREPGDHGTAALPPPEAAATSVPSWRAIVAQPGVPEALFSGLGFGLFFVFIYRASEAAGHWPLVGARLVSVVMFTVIALATTTAVLPQRGSRRAVVLAGLLDATAAVLFVLSVRMGLLSVGAVLAALYPVVTVVLARVVTKERIRRQQIVGLALALAAIGLLAV